MRRCIHWRYGRLSCKFANLQPAEPRESAWNRRRQAKALVFLARQARPYLQDLLRSHSTGENDSLPKSRPHKISRAVATQARLVPSSSSATAYWIMYFKMYV